MVSAVFTAVPDTETSSRPLDCSLLRQFRVAINKQLDLDGLTERLLLANQEQSADEQDSMAGSEACALPFWTAM